MKYLTAEFKKLHPRVFNEHATANAIFPYVVFKFTSSTNLVSDREDIILEIDIWDTQKDGYDATLNVELLTDKIDKFLKKNRHIDDNQFLMFQKINRLNLPDEDTNVRRRQLRYVVKYYDKNQ